MISQAGACSRARANARLCCSPSLSTEVPAARLVEHRCQPLETEALEGVAHTRRSSKPSTCGRVGQHLAQRSRRQIRRARQVQRVLARGRAMRPVPQGHRPASARKNRVVRRCRSRRRRARARRPSISTCGSASVAVPAGEEISRSSMVSLPGSRARRYSMRLATSCMSSQSTTSARRKLATRSSVARQSAMVLKLSTNQRSEDCTWMKAPDAIIRPPKDSSAREIQRRRHQDRRDQREPAVAGGHPGQIGRAGHQRGASPQHAVQIELDAPRLVRLAARERDRIDVLVHAHQREAQIRLAGIALGVAIDQALAHPVAQQRGRAGIEDRGPHHVARDRDGRARRRGTRRRSTATRAR